MPDSSKSLIATITLCLLIVCSAAISQDTPEVPNASSISNAKPTLAELMARFAEIESSYLPFHIDYSESLTQKLGPFLAGVTDDEPNYEYRAERGHRDLKIWMRETTIINAGVSRTERSVTNEAGHHLKETSPAPRFFDGDGVSESAEPQVRPLEGVFPLMFHTDAPILLSQHYAAEPKEFAFIWHDKLARVWCRHRSDNGLHVQVELWLDPDFAWHPVFMRRYFIQGEPLSVGERYADEWKVTEFRKLNELVRVSAGEFSGPIRRTTKTDESREAFVRSRFRILKSTYQTRVPDLVFSPETPIGGSPIAELEPVGGEQVEVKSTEIAELSLPLLTPEEIVALTAVTNQQSATEMRPAASLNPTSTALPDEIQSQIAALEVELIVQKADLGERHPTIKKLNDKITALREAGAELLGQVTVLHLKNARAKDAAEKIEQLFPDKTRNLVVDERTNSLMLRGDEKLIRDVEQIVQILDAAVPPVGENANTDPNLVPSMKTPGETLPVPATRSPFSGEHSEHMSTFAGSLASNPPVPIAEYRRRLANLETPVLQLAEKVRAAETSLGKDHPDAVKQRAELRALVRKNFAERQEIQRAELAEFTRRLERMQRSIETREKIGDKIVERRVEVLLDPDIDWSDSISIASTPDSTDDIDRPEANSDIEEVPPSHSQEPFSIDHPLEGRSSLSGSVPDHQTQLRICIDALVRDVDEFEDRTPLKLLMEFKDQPVLQITDEFKAAISSFLQQVKLDAPRAKLEECFAPVSQHGAAFVQAWGNVKSQPAKVVLNEIADDIVGLERCIASLDQSARDGAKLNSAPEPLAVKRNVAELEADKETVSLTLLEVTDAKFMPSDDTNVGQTAAPADFDDQLANMLKNKTANLIGKHTIETTRNQLATLHSGGKFEVPSSSPEKKAEVVFGTTIEITPGTLNGERVFQILWSERVRNFENAVNGIPGIDEKRIEVNINSPSPGGAGYLFGPLKGKNQTRRMFVHFLLHSASSVEPPGLRHDPSTEPEFKDPNAALRPRLQSVTGETTADHSFVRGEILPKSDAEKSIGRLVLVFANDAARRMVPALMVKHGERTLALTVGPATIVPDDTPHAIDRTFLEFYNRDDVPTEYSQELEFPDLRAYEAKESLTEFRLGNPVTVELSDQLSAIINHGQADFKVTSRAARVTALEQSTTSELPSHNVTREFRGLIQIDQRLPEGTPLFKNGELAGITLLGTRFMKEDIAGSYVVPASRIFEVLRQVETK
jgi:hypothetical protein